MSFYSDIIRARKPGLVAYYRANETSGSQLADSSGNSYPPATLSGSFTLGQPCVIAGESAISFDGLTGTLSLPGALNIGSWPVASLEFWIQQTGVWQQVVVTMSNASGTTLLYLNGMPYSSGTGDPVLVDIDLFYAGSPMNGSLSSVSLYSIILTPAQVATSYAVGYGGGSSEVFVSQPGLFGIGTYQSISGGTTIGAGWPPVTQGYVLGNPYDGVYGGTYGWVLDTRIRAPKQLIVTPAPTIGLDNTGLPVVRGYPSQTWAYSTLRPDFWYYLMNVYNQAARQPPGFQYLVLIQYPGQDGTNTPVQVLARMDPPTQGFRSVGAFWSPTLRFTYIGQAALSPATPITILS